jgi:hypothetical protein
MCDDAGMASVVIIRRPIEKGWTILDLSCQASEIKSKTRSAGLGRRAKSLLTMDLVDLPSVSPKTCYSSRPEGRLMCLSAAARLLRAERL